MNGRTDVINQTATQVLEEQHAVMVRCNYKHIVGYFAQFACRQSPYAVPDQLEEACKWFRDKLTERFVLDNHGWANVERKELKRAIRELILQSPFTPQWNRCKRGDTPNHIFVDRYSSPRNPDRDFIDLDALWMNVCSSVLDQASCCEHDSDCAVHNAPALPVGPCDCSTNPQPPTGTGTVA